MKKHLKVTTLQKVHIMWKSDSIRTSYQIPAISSCLFYLILRELYITLIGILSHKKTPVMINCILSAFELFLHWTDSNHTSLPSSRYPFWQPSWNILPSWTSPFAYRGLDQAPVTHPSSIVMPLCIQSGTAPCGSLSAKCLRWPGAEKSPLLGEIDTKDFARPT